MKHRNAWVILALEAVVACGDTAASTSPAGEANGGGAGSVAPGPAGSGGSGMSGALQGAGGTTSGSSGGGSALVAPDAGGNDSGEATRDASSSADAQGADAKASAPRVWVSSDLTDPKSNNATDTDDIVTLSAFLLVLNKVSPIAIVVGATPFSSCPSALPWINANVVPAYEKEVGHLNAKIGGYPATLPFLQASTCQKKFDPAAAVDLGALPTVKGLIDAAKAGPLFVLNWGPMNETASAIKYLLTAGDTATLDHVTVISHWTSPSSDYNCNVDAAACAYVHQQASLGKVKLYELGPMGQRGLVDNSCNTGANLNQSTMYASAIGKLMSAKWNGSGWPDMSDGATYFVLTGFGGGIAALKPDGTFDAAGPNRLCNDRGKIASVLEAAATAAAQ